jgi:superfamily II DNA/RNA helicase
MLRDLIRSEGVETGIIFCNRKTTVRELNTSLKRHGFRSGEIHGDIDQATRLKELDAFKSGKINLLVASDVAARGLDIKGVSHVFNFDAPWHPDDYVHRIGRTGRAGAKGKAFTFVTKADEEAIENIEKLIGTKIERLGKVEAPVKDAEEKPKSAKRDRHRKDASKPRPERAAKPTKSTPPAQDEVPDDGWNGPMPSFLGFSILT